MILDATADQEQIKKTLSHLQEKMEELQKRAFTYKSYQKNFKVEVTKYEELEEVHAELKLKQLLWDSIDEWDRTVNHWRTVSSFCNISFMLLKLKRRDSLMMYKACHVVRIEGRI